MLRRLYHEQPDSFAFTEANRAWAEAQVTKYPKGRQASAVIPILWRAQEQEGWLSRPAIEYVADMLGMAYIRVLEVASFYFMFQMQPVGTIAHIQVCGTTSCMICGAEDLIGLCKEKIAPAAHQLSEDGKFSWEEVECLGACANAPMAQIGKDYYEDLTAARLGEIIDEMAEGKLPVPGPQNGRYTSEPKSGLTSLDEFAKNPPALNASAQLASDIGDTIRRIDGTEVPLRAPWQQGANHGETPAPTADETSDKPKPSDKPKLSADETPAKPKSSAEPASDNKGGAMPGDAAPSGAAGGKAEEAQASKLDAQGKASVPASGPAEAASEPAEGTRPQALDAPREGGADDLKRIKGIGPKLEALCNSLGFYHFDQIAAWTGAEVAWVDQNLAGFKGRVTRDNWVEQARTLAKGGDTEFSKRVDKGGVY